MKQTNVIHDGKVRYISEMSFDGNIVSGRVSGKYIEVPVGDYMYAYRNPGKSTPNGNAAHCLINAHDMIYGYKPLTYAERAKCRRTDVTNAHIECISKGRTRLTCKVNGEPITIDYKGTVTNDNGETFTAKPFLGVAREDARRKARTMKRLRELMAEMESVVRNDTSLKEEVSTFLTLLTA